MFEVFIGCLIAFAGGYVLLMRMMARSADVLHGEFIQSDGRQRSVSALSSIGQMLRSLRRTPQSAGGKI